jgi:hypothetical protein
MQWQCQVSTSTTAVYVGNQIDNFLVHEVIWWLLSIWYQEFWKLSMYRSKKFSNYFLVKVDSVRAVAGCSKFGFSKVRCWSVGCWTWRAREMQLFGIWAHLPQLQWTLGELRLPKLVLGPRRPFLGHRWYPPKTQLLILSLGRDEKLTCFLVNCPSEFQPLLLVN